jgi:hypothetical protein
VKEVILPSHSTDAALIAMVHAFLITEIVEEIAYVTEVNSEGFVAALALTTYCLLKSTS